MVLLTGRYIIGTTAEALLIFRGILNMVFAALIGHRRRVPSWLRLDRKSSEISKQPRSISNGCILAQRIDRRWIGPMRKM